MLVHPRVGGPLFRILSERCGNASWITALGYGCPQAALSFTSTGALRSSGSAGKSNVRPTLVELRQSFVDSHEDRVRRCQSRGNTLEFPDDRRRISTRASRACYIRRDLVPLPGHGRNVPAREVAFHGRPCEIDIEEPIFSERRAAAVVGLSPDIDRPVVVIRRSQCRGESPIGLVAGSCGQRTESPNAAQLVNFVPVRCLWGLDPLREYEQHDRSRNQQLRQIPHGFRRPKASLSWRARRGLYSLYVADRH